MIYVKHWRRDDDNSKQVLMNELWIQKPDTFDVDNSFAHILF